MIWPIWKLIERLQEIQKGVGDTAIECDVPCIMYKHANGDKPHRIEFYDIEERHRQGMERSKLYADLAETKRKLEEETQYDTTGGMAW